MDASASSIEDADATRALDARIRSSLVILAAIRAIECLLVGASAGAVSIAAVIAAGGSASTFDARAAASLAVVFAAAAWWLERAPDVAYVVRRIDRAEGWSGELVTAYETGQQSLARASSTELDRLLGRRVLAKLPLRACLRAVAPRSVALLGLPLVSAAVLFVAVDRGGDAGDALETPGLQAAIDSLASASASLRSAAKSAAPAGVATENARALNVLADSLEGVDRDLRTHALSPREARAALDDAIARLNSAAIDSSADPALTEHLSRAQRALADARSQLARDADSQAPPSSTSHALPSTNGSGEGSAPSAGIASNPSAPSSTSQVAPEIPSIPTDEQGTSAGRWWSQRYDVVVQRWVESLREDGTGRPRTR